MLAEFVNTLARIGNNGMSSDYYIRKRRDTE